MPTNRNFLPRIPLLQILGFNQLPDLWGACPLGVQHRVPECWGSVPPEDGLGWRLAKPHLFWRLGETHKASYCVPATSVVPDGPGKAGTAEHSHAVEGTQPSLEKSLSS